MILFPAWMESVMLPIKLALNNFLSHTKSELDFTKFNVSLILGNYEGNTDVSNGSGKSAIFSGISYALFNKGRGKKIDDVVKKGEKLCVVEFDFELDGCVYRIVRKRDKFIKQSSVQLYQLDGDNFIDISADTNTLTDVKIAELIKFNYDVFVNSVYFKQGDIDLFINTTASKRKEILRSLLNIDKWEDYYKVARDNHKVLSTKITDLNSLLLPEHSIVNELENKKQDLTALHQARDLENEKYLNRGSYLNTLENKYKEQYNDTKNIPIKIKTLQLEKEKTQKRIAYLKSITYKNDNQILDNEDELNKYNEKLKTIKEKIKAKDGINLKILNDKMLVGKTKSNILKNKISELSKDLEFGDECDKCYTKIKHNHIESIKQKRLEERKNSQNELDILQVKLKKATEILQQKTSTVEIANKALLEKGKIDLFVNNLHNSIKSLTEENKRNNKEIKELSEKSFDKEINDLKQIIDGNNIETIKELINSTKLEVAEISQKRDQLYVKYGSTQNAIIELEKKQKEQKELLNKISELNHKVIVYDKLKNCFGKDGIQSTIIEGIVGELEHYTNETLAKICNEPTNVSIKMQKISENGNINETFDIEVSRGGEVDDIEVLSGGEKFRISLALRLALSKILAKKIGGVVKFLLLDEVSSTLDTKGVNVFVNIIKQLSSEFKIMLISHDEQVKEHFDSVISVHKNSSGSSIVQ